MNMKNAVLNFKPKHCRVSLVPARGLAAGGRGDVLGLPLALLLGDHVEVRARLGGAARVLQHRREDPGVVGPLRRAVHQSTSSGQ